jgi:Nif-specific regulatory protein
MELINQLQVAEAANQIARLLSKTEQLQHGIEELIAVFITLAKADEGAIQLLRPSSRSTRYTLIRRNSNHIRLLDKQLDDFLTGCVLKENDSFINHDLHALLGIEKMPGRYAPIRSVLSAPIRSNQEIIGVVNLLRAEREETFSETEQQMISRLAGQIGDFMESAQIRENLFNQNIRLQKNLESKYALHGIIGSSPKFKEVYHVMEQVIPTDARVVILGESGTGKELIARCIHFAGPRKDQPFVAVDCGALPPTLLESELFGYVRGAFTGAVKDRCGLIEEADGGTLFLDEITNMSMETQAKLLRFIQEEEIRPVGSNQIKKVDVRIIVAASGNLNEELSPQRIRSDLFYRLNVISIHIPPLRERMEDIPELAAHFLRRFSKKHHKSLSRIGADTLQCLENYSWPGNIRELENLIERAVVMADYKAKVLKAGHLSLELNNRKPAQIPRPSGSDNDLPDLIADYERRLILDTLTAHRWNQTAAARALNISEAVMRYKIKKLNLQKPT